MVQINSHLTTTNPYVQRQIIRDNISRIKNVISCFKVGQVKSREFRECKELFKSQSNLLSKLDKIINDKEQLSFPINNSIF